MYESMFWFIVILDLLVLAASAFLTLLVLVVAGIYGFFTDRKRRFQRSRTATGSRTPFYLG